MRSAWVQIRLLLAETLLGWAFAAVPRDSPDKRLLARLVVDYCRECTARRAP